MTTQTTTMTQDAVNTLTGEKPAMLQVFTVPQTCAAGTELVACNTRASLGKTIPADQKMRCIVIPELSVDNVPSKFQSLVMQALRSTAKAQLDSIWKKDPLVQSVPAAIWNVDSLLIFAAAESESTRLTKKNCEDWFVSSELAAHLMAATPAAPKKYESWKARIIGMASPVLGLNADQCSITIAAIGKFENDASSLIGSQMIAKLQARIDSIEKQNDDIEAV